MFDHRSHVESSLKEAAYALRKSLQEKNTRIKISKSRTVGDVDTRGGFIKLGIIDGVDLHLWKDQSLRGDQYDFWVGLFSDNEAELEKFVAGSPETFRPITTLSLSDYDEEPEGWRISRRLSDGELSRPIKEGGAVHR